MAIFLLPIAIVIVYSIIAIYIHNGSLMGKPIYSRYVSFNSRDIIYELANGKRVVRRVSREFGDAFPIPTANILNDSKVVKEILEDNLSEFSKIQLAISYKVSGEGDERLIGSKFLHLIQ
jgi:hypothetical protein